MNIHWVSFTICGSCRGISSLRRFCWKKQLFFRVRLETNFSILPLYDDLSAFPALGFFSYYSQPCMCYELDTNNFFLTASCLLSAISVFQILWFSVLDNFVIILLQDNSVRAYIAICIVSSPSLIATHYCKLHYYITPYKLR